MIKRVTVIFSLFLILLGGLYIFLKSNIQSRVKEELKNTLVRHVS
ncbi:MAG: hypothetical protein ACRC8F_03125 [Cetobacterium sp.]